MGTVRHDESGSTILIVDDHELVAMSLAYGLRAEGLRAHHCLPRDGALQTATGLTPGLVLLDLDLGRDAEGRSLDGVALVAPLRAAGWQVLVLSGTADRARVGAALAEGAVAAVPKAAPLPRLIAAVRAALDGAEVMPPERRRELIEAHRQRVAQRRERAEKLARLTQREREVLAALADGRRAQTIADTFVVSLATVRTQIRAILTKLEVSSQLEAVALYRGSSRT